MSFNLSIITLFSKTAYYLNRLGLALTFIPLHSKNTSLNFVEKYVSEKRITFEYAWICLNKQSFEYASVLSMPDIAHNLRSLYKELSTS